MASVLEAVTNKKPVLITGLSAKRFTASTLALATVLATSVPAWSTIDNTVTATGSSPGNTDDITATDSENVDVEDAAPSFIITKTADVTTDVSSGDTITYTYTVENDGNVSLENVSIADTHEGDGAAVVPGSETLTTGTNSTDAAADGTWDSLAPGEIVTWTATYLVTVTDVANQADNDLDNTATVTATPAAGTFDPGQDFDDTEEVDLEDLPSLTVSKIATLLNGGALADPNAANAGVGDVITYTYTVTNNGNVPITDITLSDNVTAGSGTAPTPAGETLLTDNGTLGDSTDAASDGSWDTLGVNDVITFTGTYTVTQDDVDDLQ